MANISSFAGKLLLDFLGGGATATQPTMRWVGLAWGTPTSTGGSEINSSMGYSRITVSIAAANSPAGSASNAVAMTFGPFSSIMSILGLQIWNTQTPTSGEYLLYGTLQTARTVGVGDSLVVAIGALVITLS